MVELHNAELEAHVLMSLIDVHTTYDKYHDRLNPSLFFYAQNQIIFNAIERIKTENPLQTLDMMLIQDELNRTNQLEAVGGEEYLAKIMSVMGLSNIDTPINRLAEYNTLRNIENACKSAMRQIADGGSVADITTSLIDTVSDTQRGNNQVVLHTPQTLLSGMVERIKSYQTDGIPYVYLGFVELSLKLALKEGRLFVLAGRPSMGKTALGMNMVSTIAKNNRDKTALVFSLEMGAEDIINRVVSSEGGIDNTILQGGEEADENEWGKLADTITQLQNDLPLVIIDEKNLTIQDIRMQCARVKREFKRGISVIMVDYLTFMGGLDGVNGTDRINRIGEITKQLKMLGAEYNCPVILLSQLNRSLENRPDKRPVSSDLRDSGTIEQDADIIAMIYRDEVYRANTEHKGIAEIIVTKNRHGAIGTVKLGFEGKYSRFTDYIPHLED